MINKSNAEQLLGELFLQTFAEEAKSVSPLPLSGSNRLYFRLSGEKRSVIGVYNHDRKENAAFVSFSQSLRKSGVRVPEVFATDCEKGIYLQQDLGDITLFSLLEKNRAASGAITPEIKELYKTVLADLAHIQTVGSQVIDFSLCYPRAAFDRQSISWDLQYFKYYILKLAHIQFDEQELEKDFEQLTTFLLNEDCNYFLYRDFQSRNIMIFNGQPWYIDFQGGRRGAREYDVASLLFDAKADLSSSLREELLNSYLANLEEVEQQRFTKYFYAYVLVRIMQAMGAYGYRGYFERKTHFLRSIPFAIENLRFILSNHLPDIELTCLWRVLADVCDSSELRAISRSTRLRVRVSSFSYKKGAPVDSSGNGGGFVFDCRALPNPGRYEQYKSLTGRDAEVKQFFAGFASEMDTFLQAAQTLISQSIEQYQKRGFTSLMVSFGCTGGQHRSVYCADTIARWITDTYDCDVDLLHCEQKQLSAI